MCRKAPPVLAAATSCGAVETSPEPESFEAPPALAAATSCGDVESSPEPESFEASYEMTSLELGQGTSGVICAAVCRRTGKTVAVKTYMKDRMSYKELRCMWSELAVHRRLSHPGIVALEGTYESIDCVHVVMEHLHGGELLDHVLQHGRLSEQETAEVVVQLLEALAYLHDRNIVHRDVKLENVMFEENGGSRVKLIDLGYATTCNPKTNKLTQGFGTREYAAPEMLAGKPYDEKVDVWSAGAVVYSLLIGRHLVVDGRATFGDEFRALPAEARSFVQALVHADPGKRSSARQALEHPWLQQFAPAQQWRMPLQQPAAEKALARQSLSNIFFKGLAFGILTIC